MQEKRGRNRTGTRAPEIRAGIEPGRVRKHYMTGQPVGAETFWALVQGSPLAIFAVDSKAHILVWNPAAERLFGWSEQDILGRLNPIVPEGKNAEFSALRKRALKGEVFTGMEVRVRKKDETLLDISISTAPLRDAAGTIVGLMAVTADISERRRMDDALRESLKKQQRIFDETVNALASAVEKRDPYTAGHQQRVAQLACAMAGEMGFSSEQIRGIRTAALVHDIGKLYVPAEILSKPGRLTEAEFSILKTHPQAGYEILKDIEFPWPIALIVQQHHEHLDGSGYPLGLKGEDILLEARILSIADVVEATSSHRPYRPAKGVAASLREISDHKGDRYAPEAVDACLKVFKRGFRLEPCCNQ